MSHLDMSCGACIRRCVLQQGACTWEIYAVAEGAATSVGLIEKAWLLEKPDNPSEHVCSCFCLYRWRNRRRGRVGPPLRCQRGGVGPPQRCKRRPQSQISWVSKPMDRVKSHMRCQIRWAVLSPMGGVKSDGRGKLPWVVSESVARGMLSGRLPAGFPVGRPAGRRHTKVKACRRRIWLAEVWEAT